MRGQSYWVYSLVSVAVVSATALVGTVALALQRRLLERLLPFSVSLAAGALLGAAGAHLVPEAIEELGIGRRFSVLFTAGFAGLFLLERAVGILSASGSRAGHNHGLEHQQELFRKMDGGPGSTALIANILLGGAIHSFIDGVAVATAYGAGSKTGLATTVAVLLHEIPHHIGDVGVLIYSGLPARRAVILNILATSSSILGALLVLVPGSRVAGVTSLFLPVSAASFLYIAAADLMPELQHEPEIRRSAAQILVLWAGVLLMFLL